MRMLSSRLPLSASKIAMAPRPRWTVATASRRLSGAHDPDDPRNWRLSKWGSDAVLVSRRTFDPVFVSATYSSIDSRLRSDRNAMRSPFGLSDGPTFIVPLPVRSASSARGSSRRASSISARSRGTMPYIS